MSPRTMRRSPPPTAVPIPAALSGTLQRIGQLASDDGMRAYAVGGCVRDWLLGREDITDLDVVIEGDGLKLAGRLEQVLSVTVVRHTQFGTASLTLPPLAQPRRRGGAPPAPVRLDVATCRREVYVKPAAYPKVTPGVLRDDLFRRDFTINAMAASLLPDGFGTLIDPFGGVPDLQKRQLRVLHANSFIDDPSRILRAVRFAQRYTCRLEPDTKRWLGAAVHAKLLTQLNRGRLRKELDRMADEPDPLACIIRLGRWLSGSIT